MRYLASIASALVSLASVVGCGSLDKTAASPGAEMIMGDDAIRWPYWPTRVRIHPLTRVVRDEKTARKLIEARIEFFDRDGSPTRGFGELRIDLHDRPTSSLLGAQAKWEMDLRVLEFNNERYDDVTRTYLFPLEVDPDQLLGQPVLKVYFLSAEGVALPEARYQLRMR